MRCDDTCPDCIYIGEGDFICSFTNNIVIDEWKPVTGICSQKKDNIIPFKKKLKENNNG